MSVEKLIREQQQRVAQEIVGTLELCEGGAYWANPSVAAELQKRGWLRCTGSDTRGDVYYRTTEEGKQALEAFKQTEFYQALRKQE